MGKGFRGSGAIPVSELTIQILHANLRRYHFTIYDLAEHWNKSIIVDYPQFAQIRLIGSLLCGHSRCTHRFESNLQTRVHL